MNFNDVGLDIPLNNKVKRGAKKKIKPSLQFQPPDYVQQQAENEILESEDDDELEIDERPAKIAKTSSQCSTSSLRFFIFDFFCKILFIFFNFFLGKLINLFYFY